MGQTSATRIIRAPLQLVFDTVANIENYSEVVPNIIKVEFLSKERVGVGTRFRETRKIGKREGCTELEVTEYEDQQHVRIISDQGGTIWDTTFSTKQVEDGAVELKMVMDARAYKLAAKLLNPLISGMIQKAVENDLDMVKAHCEYTEGTSSAT